MKKIILRVENNFTSKKDLKLSMKRFLKENKEIKPKKKDSKLYYDNLKDIKNLQKKLIDIDKLKDKLKEKGLSRRKMYPYIAKALCTNSEVRIEIAKLEKDIQSNVIEYIQPMEVYRTLKPNGNKTTLGLKKSKGIINRRCYKAI